MNFLKYRFVFIAISLILIITGITYGFFTGYKFDVDFKGGTKIQVDLKTEFDNNEIENIISEITGSKPLVQKMSSGQSSVSITTNVIPEETSNQILDTLNEKFPDMDEPSIRNIQPAFGKKLIESSILALLVSMFAILIYIVIRFKTLGISAAISAILALIHDVLILVAIYGIFKLPINSTFVAVMLTIIGYSINDTIVVYDRIRENKKKVTRSTDLKDTINSSINQTIKRTLFTSITTMSAILIVFIFAYLNNQQVLIEFSLPLTIGVITGTYSSIFIAASFWYIFDGKKYNKLK